MDLDLLKDTTERMTDRFHAEFRDLAETQGMGFAASAMTTVLARSLGLVLAMAKTDETRQATMLGFSMLVEKTMEEHRASIEAGQAIDKAMKP